MQLSSSTFQSSMIRQLSLFVADSYREVRRSQYLFLSTFLCGVRWPRAVALLLRCGGVSLTVCCLCQLCGACVAL